MNALRHIRATLGDPWGLTTHQGEIVERILKEGSVKAAAYDLGLSIKTVSSTLAVVRKKMGVKTNLHAFLAWRDWRMQ